MFPLCLICVMIIPFAINRTWDYRWLISEFIVAQVTDVKATEIEDASGNDADTEGSMGKHTRKKHRKAVNGTVNGTTPASGTVSAKNGSAVPKIVNGTVNGTTPASGTVSAKNGSAVPKSSSAADHAAKRVAPYTAKSKPSTSKKVAGNTAKAGNSQAASKPASKITSKEKLPVVYKNLAVQASSSKLNDDKASTKAAVAPSKLARTKPMLANNFNDWFSKARIGIPQPAKANSSYGTKIEEDVASQVSDTSEATVV